MFGRKKDKRILTDWPSLQDALVAFFDATQTPEGDMSLRIEWKAEKRHQEVRVTHAPTPLGPVAFVTAPLLSAPTESQLKWLMSQSAKLLMGGIVLDNGIAHLRSTVPFEGTAFSEIDAIIRQLAANADNLREEITEIG